MHKTPTSVGFGKGIGRRPYPQFFGDSRTRTHNMLLWMEGTCHHIKAQPHANDTMSKINHTQSKYNIFSYAIKKTNILHKIPNEATPLAHTCIFTNTNKTKDTDKTNPKSVQYGCIPLC